VKEIHTSTFVCCFHPWKEARPQTNDKKKIRRRKARTFCFWKTGFVHSRSGTYNASLLGYFCLKFLLDILHCVYWVLVEVSAPDSFHKIGNKFFIRRCHGSVLRWKKFTQALSYVVSTQARRHVHKQITKKRYREEKRGHFVFGKPVLFTLGLGLTTPYGLGIFVWNLYQTFVIVSIEFWLRFKPQIRPTRLAIIFLFVTARVERKDRLCVKLFDFFRGWILIRLTWNLSRFVHNSVDIPGWNFRKKLFRENFLEILCKPRLSSTETCEIPA